MLWDHVQIIDVPTSGAFTLGSKVIGSAPKKHEQGHYYQNLALGPAYIFVIAIPSLVNYWLSKANLPVALLCGSTLPSTPRRGPTRGARKLCSHRFRGTAST